jgi:plastocyanin
LTLGALALALAAAAAAAAGEIRGRLVGEHVFPAVVYVESASGSFSPPADRATMKQAHLRFIPPVLPVLLGTTVDFVNDDEMNHNVFSPTAKPFDLGTFGSGSRSHTFSDPGAYIILCNIHVEMVGWVLVLRTPWFAPTDKDGAFTLHAPGGPQRIAVWRPRFAEESRTVDVTGGTIANLDWTVSENRP